MSYEVYTVLENYKRPKIEGNISYLKMANTVDLNQIKGILNAFEDFEITLLQFFHGILGTNIFETHPVTLSLSEDGHAILSLFKSSNGTSVLTTQWVSRVAKETYRTQMQELTKKENGFHFCMRSRISCTVHSRRVAGALVELMSC